MLTWSWRPKTDTKTRYLTVKTCKHTGKEWMHTTARCICHCVEEKPVYSMQTVKREKRRRRRARTQQQALRPDPKNTYRYHVTHCDLCSTQQGKHNGLCLTGASF